MNRFTRLIACSVLVCAPVLVLAQGNAQDMRRGGMMDQEQMQKMQENMSRMQGMMQEMRNAESDAERQKIREKHMEFMQNHMDMMRGGMMGEGMKGRGMMGNGKGMMNNQGTKQSGDAPGNRSGGAGMDYEQRLEMMEQRMNQMQLMMEQMLEHQARSQNN